MEKLREFSVDEVSPEEFDESSDDMAFVYVSENDADSEMDSMKIRLMASRSELDEKGHFPDTLVLENDVMSLTV